MRMKPSATFVRRSRYTRLYFLLCVLFTLFWLLWKNLRILRPVNIGPPEFSGSKTAWGPDTFIAQAPEDSEPIILDPAERDAAYAAAIAELRDSVDDKEEFARHFPNESFCDALIDRSDELPEIIFLPFEQTVADVPLAGWEDEWISTARYNAAVWGKLEEPKLDFVYTWVNGTEDGFVSTMQKYELKSDLYGEKWMKSHRTNRYREWNELMYSIRSVEKHVGRYVNKFNILVNAIVAPSGDGVRNIIKKQWPSWMALEKPEVNDKVSILSMADFFEPSAQGCLPTYNSLTIEAQMHNIKSTTDRYIAMSDDMLIGGPHAPSDFWSPLFGPIMAFKKNSYDKETEPTAKDAKRFGEKPYLLYSSWLLNRRFGSLKRKGQVHFAHSMSRSLTKEALSSFPALTARSAMYRFRGEEGFQIYTWFVTFHYNIERFREALLWSLIQLRADANGDGYLDAAERRLLLAQIQRGAAKEEDESRVSVVQEFDSSLEEAGLSKPLANQEILWTSMDGPSTFLTTQCTEFDVEQCLGLGFESNMADESGFKTPFFDTAAMFRNLAHNKRKCGDCLLKFVLNNAERGFEPILPHKSQPEKRKLAVQALMRYQYTIVNPSAWFIMLYEPQYARDMLLDYVIKQNNHASQYCLNDDVYTDDEAVVGEVKDILLEFFETLQPNPSSLERDRDPFAPPLFDL